MVKSSALTKLTEEKLLFLIFLGLFIIPHLISNTNFHHILIIFVIFAALGQSWNIITGFAGQTSFGHAAFFGIGAYTSSVLFWKFQISPWLGMLLGAVLASLVAAIVSYPCFRLKGHYFAIATLAVAEIIQQIFVSWKYVEGATGISLPIVDDSLLSLQFHTSKLPYFYIALLLFALVVITAYKIEKSKMGFYLKAIRESHEVAESIGINPLNYKLYAMMTSAFFSALFGSLYAQYILYIDPFMVFSLPISMKIVLLTVLGGLGNIFGPIIGAAILIPLSEYTRILIGGTGKGIDLILFGLLVVIVSCYQPKGIIGLFKGWRNPIRKAGAQDVKADSSC